MELIEDAKELLQKVKNAKTEAEGVILMVKIAALIITIQCVIFTMEKIKNTIETLNNVMEELGLQGITPFTAISHLEKILTKIKDILKELHYARLNEPDQDLDSLPDSPEEAIKRGFLKAPDGQNRYHRNKGQSGNTKYYHPVTGQEVVFDENGEIVTIPENTGTKNYGPDPISWDHIKYDILPYWIWGNSDKDTTPIRDRIFGKGK